MQYLAPLLYLSPLLYLAVVLMLCGLPARKSRRRMLKANERYNRGRNRSRPNIP